MADPEAPRDAPHAPGRVALIASSYAPHIGGVETHVARVARELSRSGVPVEVWAVDRGAPAPDTHTHPVRMLPSPLPAGTPGALARFAGRAPKAWSSWARATREFRPTVLHVQCFGPNGLYALALHRRFGIPLVVTSHGETLADDGGAFARSAQLRAGLRMAITNSAAVTAPSEFVLGDLRANYGLEGGRVVRNGVDLDVVPSGSAPATGEYLFAAGRLGRMKGIDLLIEAFTVASLDASTRLVIAGEGPEEAELRRLVRRHRLDDRVIFAGWMDAGQLATAMAQALAVVVPSRVEAFGIVALEAWRSGAALVMTNRGGAGEFVSDGRDGLLIDPTDTGALARALERVSADRELRETLAAAGRNQVAEFGWDRVAARYVELYADLPGGRAA